MRTAEEEKTYRLALSQEFDKLRRDAFARMRDLLRASESDRKAAGYGGLTEGAIVLKIFRSTQEKIEKRLEEFDRT